MAFTFAESASVIWRSGIPVRPRRGTMQVAKPKNARDADLL
jgi:hypothetical protein